jgi:hypothetical protein
MRKSSTHRFFEPKSQRCAIRFAGKRDCDSKRVGAANLNRSMARTAIFRGEADIRRVYEYTA